MGIRRGWQRHSVDEYREYMDEEWEAEITAGIDPELLFPDETETLYVDWDEYFENWEHYNKEYIDE
jgi:hypothetical protein